jgi:hypothetical protein
VGNLSVELLITLGHHFKSEFGLHSYASALTHGCQRRWIVEELTDGRSQRPDVIWFDEQSGFLVLDELGDPTDLRGNHRHAFPHGFEDDQGGRVPPRRYDEE